MKMKIRKTLPNRFKFLEEKADLIRREVIEVCVKNGAGHIAPSLSCIDILVALYYELMNISGDTCYEKRDRLVFSKAHGCYGLYAILADKGYIPEKEWKNFYNGSSLPGCVERQLEYRIEAGCGALGHGLPMAVGIAFGAKLQKQKYRVYCIVGDGEMQEGSCWEAVQFAVKHQLSNLTVIIDNNGLQAIDSLENIMTPKGKIDDLKKKFEAFGFKVRTCDGHRTVGILRAINAWKGALGKHIISVPQVLIANTIKGYGLHCMENVPKFHFRIPTRKEMKEGGLNG